MLAQSGGSGDLYDVMMPRGQIRWSSSVPLIRITCSYKKDKNIYTLPVVPLSVHQSVTNETTKSE